MKFSLLIVSIFLIGLVSANGLNINPDSYEVNKTHQVEKIVQFNITNEESFNFYNITADKILIFDGFNLTSGQTKTINARIDSNSDYEGTIRIKGDYITTLGQSNKTEDVILDNEGLDICDLNLIEGDSIKFYNSLSGEVKLKNLNTGDYFETVPGGQNRTINFESAIEFDYQVFKVGLPFSQVCHLNIMSTEGLVHNADYDELINLTLKIQYPETSVSATFLTDNFVIEYGNDAEDIFKIETTGDNLAKDIRLSGEWVEFEYNNFDLSRGDSRNIPFKIRPIILSTNQTNKTYKIPIKIEGNFDTVEKNISIFIPYKPISSPNEVHYDRESGKNFVSLHCQVYPEDCPTKVIYANESNTNITLVSPMDTWREFLIASDKERENSETRFNFLAEEITGIKNKTDNFDNISTENLKELTGVKNSTENLLGTIIFIVLMALTAIAVIILMFIIFNPNLRNKIVNISGFHKGEKGW